LIGDVSQELLDDSAITRQFIENTTSMPFASFEMNDESVLSISEHGHG